MNITNKITKLEALKMSEQIMDESIDPTFSLYPNGTYRYINKAFATPLGKVPDEIISKIIWDVFDKDKAGKRFTVLNKLFTEGKLIEIEIRVSRPTGDLYFLTTVKPIFMIWKSC